MDEIRIVSPVIRKCNCGGEQRAMVSFVSDLKAFMCDKCHEATFEITNPMAAALSKLSSMLQDNGISFESID